MNLKPPKPDPRLNAKIKTIGFTDNQLKLLMAWYSGGIFIIILLLALELRSKGL